MNFKSTKKIIAVISCVMVLCLAFAGCTATTGTTGTTGTTSTSGTIQFVLSIVVLFAVFYFFMIRPENKKKKKIQEMRSALGVGDKIVTIGGIVGEIVSTNGDNFTIETGEDRVRIQVTKWAISTKAK